MKQDSPVPFLLPSPAPTTPPDTSFLLMPRELHQPTLSPFSTQALCGSYSQEALYYFFAIEGLRGHKAISTSDPVHKERGRDGADGGDSTHCTRKDMGSKSKERAGSRGTGFPLIQGRECCLHVQGSPWLALLPVLPGE